MGVNLLEVKDLHTRFRVEEGYVKAVDSVSFDIEKGSTFGLVGESGCGKTTIGLSILRLLPLNGRIVGGQILLNGEDLATKTEKEMQGIRWKRISMIFQYALNALNPVYRIGKQLAEALRAHEKITKEEAMKRVGELFELVGLSSGRMKDYPHEFSGGMKQRAIIAMALICNPELIIADEPTTAFDVILQDKILAQIKKLQQELGLTVMYISHDISVVAEVCEEMAVMYAGQLVELTDTRTLFRAPLHPYTKGLLGSFPSIKGEMKKLTSIPGEPPGLVNPPSGCRFHPRCPYAGRECKYRVQKYREIEPNHWVLCEKAEELKGEAYG